MNKYDKRFSDGHAQTPKSKTWYSHAEWPKEVSTGESPNCSHDSHHSKRFAEVICAALEREGLGGERKIFPIRTWVSQNPTT